MLQSMTNADMEGEDELYKSLEREVMEETRNKAVNISQPITLPTIMEVEPSEDLLPPPPQHLYYNS